MKTKFDTLRLLLATVVLGVLASLAYAGPGSAYWETIRQEAQFKKLQAGDKVVYVCNECKTVSEITIESPAQAMELCKEHSTVSCPSCKMKAKAVRKGQRNDSPTHTEVVYTNEKGEECGFFVKVADKK